MAIHTKQAETTEHELIPVGRHLAVLADVVLKQNVETAYGVKDRIQLGFQLVNAHTTHGERMMAYLTCNSRSAKRSALWEQLEMWLGRSVPVEERHRFDLETLIGKSAELHIVHTPTDSGKTYANIRFIVPASSEDQNLEVEDYVREKDRVAAPTATAGRWGR